MLRFLLLLMLFSCSLANAQSIQTIPVECSDGQIEVDLADLQASKCLRITQDELKKGYSPLPLKNIDSRSLGLFIKLSKLDDAKLFAFIDALTPEEFQLIDFYAKYLQVYHELDALFKYKFLKEYSLQGANKALVDFVNSKFSIFKFVEAANKWQWTTLFNVYCPQFSMFQFPKNSKSIDVSAFFVLIDFYQKVMKKPLKLATQHLKNVFYSFDSVIQNELLNKQLVIS